MRPPFHANLWIEARTARIPESGCWLWLGATNQSGYGITRLHGGPSSLAHRTVFSIFQGPIPAGMCVLHRCDVPLCVNPSHLWLGTHLENIDDRVKKQRSHRLKGVKNPAAKLNGDKALEIFRSPLPQKELARLHNVSTTAVRKIQKRETWSFATNEAFSRALEES